MRIVSDLCGFTFCVFGFESAHAFVNMERDVRSNAQARVTPYMRAPFTREPHRLHAQSCSLSFEVSVCNADAAMQTFVFCFPAKCSNPADQMRFVP